MGRTIAIGDIHGCYDELMDLLNAIDLQPDDRVVAVGDLITKGPKNREVLDLFIDDHCGRAGNSRRTARARRPLFAAV